MCWWRQPNETFFVIMFTSKIYWQLSQRAAPEHTAKTITSSWHILVAQMRWMTKNDMLFSYSGSLSLSANQRAVSQTCFTTESTQWIGWKAGDRGPTCTNTAGQKQMIRKGLTPESSEASLFCVLVPLTVFDTPLEGPCPCSDESQLFWRYMGGWSAYILHYIKISCCGV